MRKPRCLRTFRRKDTKPPLGEICGSTARVMAAIREPLPVAGSGMMAGGDLRQDNRDSNLRTGISWVIAVLMSNLCGAQDLHPDIPPFSHYITSAQGWTCDDGYKQVAGFCVQDKQDPPGQDGVEVYDGEWRCLPGYRRTNGICALPTAPEHASLVGTNGHWECDWGFRKVAEHCEEIVPPAHGFLDAEGRDWNCFPGYDREADKCVAPGTSQ